jgi:hypothetical protein
MSIAVSINIININLHRQWNSKYTQKFRIIVGKPFLQVFRDIW